MRDPGGMANTSSDPEAPLPLFIVPGTPVVDVRQELQGTVVAVTPAFCVIQLEGAVCVSPWRDVAVGNVVPAPETLPDEIGEHDTRNAFARILREIEALDPEARPPVVVAAYEELLRVLREG